MKTEELIELNKEAHAIIKSDLEWKVKYNLIFSDYISRKIYLDYYDPNNSYEDDVCAWIYAFDKFILEYTHIKEIKW